MRRLLPLFALSVLSSCLGIPAPDQELPSARPAPHAWIHFTRYDNDVALFNGFYIYYTDRGKPLEIAIEVPPDPTHKLAFKWITKHGPTRSMTIEVNGDTKTVRHPSRGNGKQAFFWDVLPVSEFGITEKQTAGSYRLRISCPEDAEEDGVLAGIRLVTDEEQLTTPGFSRPNHKMTLISPGSMTPAERAATRIDRDAARRRVHANWVGKRVLTTAEIAADEFLAAAARYGDTVTTHGLDVYGPTKTPMFTRYLHRERLRSPASIASMPPALGGASRPIVQTQFDRTQNLLRTLAALSQATGNPKYAEAAMEATAHVFEQYAMPHSGLVVFGNHMTIDLLGDRSYSDGRSGDIFELEVVFPFYDFWHDVSPLKTERFVKGCWEVYVRDWHTMHYNRHAGFNKNIDFSKTWQRPLQEVKDLPTKMEVLGFIDVGLDLAFSGYSLGCLQGKAAPRKWADRYLKVLAYHRDPKTSIWPMLLYTPSIRRHLEVYREAFPEANVTEPRVIISSWIYSMPTFFLGTLGTIEQAKKYGHADELTEVHQRIDEWILGYMEAAYRNESHTMRSIILDGTDVTDHVFKPGKVLHGWGAKEGDSFLANPPSPSFLAAVARAYRLAGADARERYWPLLRDLFKGEGLGDPGATPKEKPAYKSDGVLAEPPCIFALADIYRVHRRAQTLELMETLGRKLISQRQDPKSGLFTLPPGRPYTMQHNQRTKEPWEGLTSGEVLRAEFGYDRPKVVSLDIIDPMALLAVYACRTAQFDKVPQWLSGGRWGTGTTCGHVINPDLESWFDPQKLKQLYKKREAWLKERGYVIGEGWHPR